MKEPWEIFDDEFMREVKRRGKLNEDGSWEIEKEEAEKAYKVAYESVVYHLVETEKWRQDDALDLMRHMMAKIPERSDETPLRQLLRDRWTDWNLKRSH